MKVLATVTAVFITLPIWFYLLYKILVAVNATDLMWFLYYAYIPFTIFVALAVRVFDD